MLESKPKPNAINKFKQSVNLIRKINLGNMKNLIETKFDKLK